MELVERSTEGSILSVNVMQSCLELPVGASISNYVTAHKKKLTKEAAKRRKYSSFSYYKFKDGTIIKGIFLDTDHYLQVGTFPFAAVEQPLIRNYKDINDAGASRLTVNFALLIGERNGQVVLKKISECDLSEKTSEIDTHNDNFERLPQGNLARYAKIAQLLQSRSITAPTSVRVTVLEDGENASVLDYDPFFVEREYLAKFKKA